MFDNPWAEEANLPEEAHAEIEGDPFEPNEHWLRRADANEQETALSVWWYSRYGFYPDITDGCKRAATF
ncbi:hypothetical protein KWH42_14270 [Xanthomonas campestris pv. daturae]|nr:hypothetical protein [Xanthomonas campestris pv. daturae]